MCRTYNLCTVETVLKDNFYITITFYVLMFHMVINVTVVFTLLLLTFFAFWKLYFLRNPAKQTPTNPSLIVSPADGLIVKIVPFGKISEASAVDKGLFGKVCFFTEDVAPAGYFIVIRLHLYDIHYQRSPLQGIVIRQRHTSGKFLNAVADAASLTATLENEKNEILIEGVVNKRKTRIKVIQVAGFLARRITSFVNEKDKIEKGQLLGVINLGSQVVLVVPKIALQVKENDRVSGGETIIGIL